MSRGKIRKRKSHIHVRTHSSAPFHSYISKIRKQNKTPNIRANFLFSTPPRVTFSFAPSFSFLPSTHITIISPHAHTPINKHYTPNIFSSSSSNFILLTNSNSPRCVTNSMVCFSLFIFMYLFIFFFISFCNIVFFR